MPVRPGRDQIIYPSPNKLLREEKVIIEHLEN
jgi:hypothetical protein